VNRTYSSHINQENLGEMVGTTWARVSHFMNNFRRLGFLDYTLMAG
jgi:CRP/FNR family cyclic AMP-dependent transcriptional regulator